MRSQHVDLSVDVIGKSLDPIFGAATQFKGGELDAAVYRFHGGHDLVVNRGVIGRTRCGAETINARLIQNAPPGDLFVGIGRRDMMDIVQ